MSKDAAAKGHPVKAARQHLELLRMSGVREVFLSPQTLAALKAPSQSSQPAKPAPQARQTSAAQPAAPRPATGETLESLAREGAARQRQYAPPQLAPLPAGPAQALAQRQNELQNCRACGLCERRNSVVYGEGAANARLMIVGEGPGADEDRCGKPFVGRAGQLLTKMLAAIKIDRPDVYIGNIVKCRPPGNRNPQPEEIRACMPFLREQIAIIQPKIILAMGGVAAHALLQSNESVGRMRQRVHMFENTPVYVTYHPAYLLRSPEMKRPAWVDLQKLQKHYDNL